MCDAVTGRNNSAGLLTQLERANLFLVPLGDHSGQGWYRYHALFAEAMRHAARERFGEEGIHALYGQASAWYERNGLLDEAIEAGLAAQQYPRAAVLVERALALRTPGELYTFRRWVEQIPQEVLRAYPTVCFEYAVTLLFTSDRYAVATAALIETPLHVAEETWRREENGARLGQALALRTLVSLWQGDFSRAFAFARESLQLLAEEDAFWRGSDLITLGIEESLAGRVDVAQNALIEARALSGAVQNLHGQLAATVLLADIYTRQGEFDQAILMYRQVQAEAIGSEDMLDDQGAAALGLCAIAYERNDLEAAERQSARALEFGAQRSNDLLTVHAGIALARVLHALGKAAQAQERLRALIAQTQHPFLVQEVLAWQARLALAMGNIESVHQWYTGIARRMNDLPLVLQEQQDLAVARMMIVDEKPQAALELLERWRADAREHGRTSTELETLALEALAWAQSDRTQAGKLLACALAIAQAKGYHRVFLDEGQPMRILISDFRFQLEKQAPRLRAFIYKLLTTFSANVTKSAAKSEIEGLRRTPNMGGRPEMSFEPLSPQEQRVLRLVAVGLSNTEIARELVVSTNTIKTQLQSIYRKLNVSNREQAREIARELKIV